MNIRRKLKLEVQIKRSKSALAQSLSVNPIHIYLDEINTYLDNPFKDIYKRRNY